MFRLQVQVLGRWKRFRWQEQWDNWWADCFNSVAARLEGSLDALDSRLVHLALPILAFELCKEAKSISVKTESSKESSDSEPEEAPSS